MNNSLEQCQQKLGIRFNNQLLLKQAFTHSSYVNENRLNNIKDNERLEFLGDAVVELTVSEYLYAEHQSYSEGELTKIRASIVCEPSLMRFAQSLNLGEYVMLGKGEEATGGRVRPSLLADLFEAFVGALFLDQGLDAARDFMNKHVLAQLSIQDHMQLDDFKSALQEYVQQHGLGTIAYHIVAEHGPSHDRQFVSEVSLGEQLLGTGKGRSKKEAEQQAARFGLQKLKG